MNSISTVVASGLVALAVSVAASPASPSGPTSAQRFRAMSERIQGVESMANHAEGIADEARNTTVCVRGAVLLHVRDDGVIVLANEDDTDVIYALETSQKCVEAGAAG